MLMNDLYRIDSFACEGGNIDAAITIDAAHDIFKGHFPGQPVLPGVCQVQIVKELLSKGVDRELFLREAAHCKFLQLIDPVQVQFLQITIRYSEQAEGLACQAVIKGGEAIFFKMNGFFVTK